MTGRLMGRKTPGLALFVVLLVAASACGNSTAATGGKCTPARTPVIESRIVVPLSSRRVVAPRSSVNPEPVSSPCAPRAALVRSPE